MTSSERLLPVVALLMLFASACDEGMPNSAVGASARGRRKSSPSRSGNRECRR